MRAPDQGILKLGDRAEFLQVRVLCFGMDVPLADERLILARFLFTERLLVTFLVCHGEEIPKLDLLARL